jgi:DHA2 family multidrug resistance protein
MAWSPHHAVRTGLIARFESLHHEHAFYRWWVLANVMIGTFMAVLDATIVNVALPKIMASFGVDVDKIEWIVTAYLLVFAVMLPTSGWVADHFGYKRTYFFALFVFTFGSFLCGLAWNENVLIGFRIVQGVGAGFLMPVGMAIITREFPVHQRGLALGFWSIAAAASVSLGPLIGGYLVDNFNWGAIFDVNIPVGLFGMFATLVVQREYRTEHVRSFDALGFVSMTVFLVCLLLALASGNSSWNDGGWSSPFILTCFALSTIGFVVFMTTELTVEHPLIELRLLKDFNFGVTNLILFIFGLGMFGSTFLLPLYLQTSLGYTALQAGAMFLPVGILQAFISPIAGIASDKLNPKIPAAIGIALLGYSLYLNSQMSLFSERDQLMLPLILRGISMGLLFTPLTTLALAGIPRHKMAQASGLFNVIRQIGGSFGVAILGTMLTRRTIHHMAAYGQAADPHSPIFENISRSMQGYIQHSVGGTIADAAVKAKALLASHVAQQSFVQAVDDDFLLASVITFVGLIPIFFLRRIKKEHKAPSPPTAAE